MSIYILIYWLIFRTHILCHAHSQQSYVLSHPSYNSKWGTNAPSCTFHARRSHAPNCPSHGRNLRHTRNRACHARNPNILSRSLRPLIYPLIITRYPPSPLDFAFIFLMQNIIAFCETC